MPARDDKPQQAALPMIMPATQTMSFAARLARPRNLAATFSLPLRQPTTDLGTRLFRRFDRSHPLAKTSTHFAVARSPLAANSLIWLSSLQRTFDSDQQDAASNTFDAPRWENTVAPLSARSGVQHASVASRVAHASTLRPLLHRTTITQHAQSEMLHRATVASPWIQRVQDHAGQAIYSALPQHGQAASTSQSPALMYRATLVPLQSQPTARTQHAQSGMLHRALAATPLLRRTPDAAQQATRSLHTAATAPLIYRSLLPFNAARITSQPQTVTQSATRGSTPAPAVTRIAALAQRMFAKPQTPLVQPLRPAAILGLWQASPAGSARGTADQRAVSLPLLRAVRTERQPPESRLAQPIARVAPSASVTTVARVSQSAARGSAPASAATPLMRRMSHQTRPKARSESQQATIIQHARGDHAASASEAAYTALPLAAATAQVMLQRIARSHLMPATAYAVRGGQMLHRLYRVATAATQPQQHPSGLQRNISTGAAWQPVLLPFVQRATEPRSAPDTSTAPADEWQPATSYSVAANRPRVQHASMLAALTPATSIQRAAATANVQRHVTAVLRVPAPDIIAQRHAAASSKPAPTASQPARAISAMLMRAEHGVHAASSASSRSTSAMFAATLAQRQLTNASARREPLVAPHSSTVSGQSASFAFSTSGGAAAIQRTGYAISGAWSALFVSAMLRRNVDEGPMLRAPSNSAAAASASYVRRASAERPSVMSTWLRSVSNVAGAAEPPVQRGRAASVAPTRPSERFAGLMRAADRSTLDSVGGVAATPYAQRQPLRSRNVAAPALARSFTRHNQFSNASTIIPATFDLLQPTRRMIQAGIAAHAVAPRQPMQTASSERAAVDKHDANVSSNIVQAAQRPSSSSMLAQRADSALMVTPLIAAAPVQRTWLARTQQPGGFTVLRQRSARSSAAPTVARRSITGRGEATAARQSLLALLQPQRRAPAPGSDSAAVLHHAPVQRATARTQHATPALARSTTVQAATHRARVSLVNRRPSTGLQSIVRGTSSVLQPLRSARVAEMPTVLQRMPGVQQHTVARPSDAGMPANRIAQRRSTVEQPHVALAFVQPWRHAASPVSGEDTRRQSFVFSITNGDTPHPIVARQSNPGVATGHTRAPESHGSLTFIQPWRHAPSPDSTAQLARAHSQQQPTSSIQRAAIGAGRLPVAQRSLTNTQAQHSITATRPVLAVSQPFAGVQRHRLAAQLFALSAPHGAVLRSPMLALAVSPTHRAAAPGARFAARLLTQRQSADPAAARGRSPRVSRMSAPLTQTQLFAVHAATSTRRDAVQRTSARSGAGLPPLARASSGKNEAQHAATRHGTDRVMQRLAFHGTTALLAGQQPTFVTLPTYLTRVARSPLAARSSMEPAAFADMRVFAQPQPAAGQGGLPDEQRVPAAVQRSTARSPLAHQPPSFTNGSMSTMPLARAVLAASEESSQATTLPMLQRWQTAHAGALASIQTNTSRIARVPLDAPSSIHPTARADMRVFTQPAAATQINAPDEVRAGAAVQRSAASLAHVQRIAQPDRATTAGAWTMDALTATATKNGAIQRTGATATSLPFVQSSNTKPPIAHSEAAQLTAGRPVGTVLQRVERADARADMPRDLLRPTSQRATETTAPIQRQQSSVVEAHAEETPDESNVDIEALAQEVYARLRRRLAIEAERIGRR